MKRIISLTLLTVAVMLLLASCNWWNKENKEEEKVTAETIWSSSILNYIVVDESTTDSESIRFHVHSLTGKTPELASPNDAVRDNEIVFGDVGRALSDTAYSKLDRQFDLVNLKTVKSSAFLIYAEGGSIAIAYSDIYSRAAACKYFVNNLNEKTYTAEGVIYSEMKKTTEFVDDFRAEEMDKALETLSMFLDDSSIKTMENFYSLYGSELYLWLANLYDPDIGGFYYSESARNTEGFLPDLESTAQGLELIENSGLANLYGGNWEDVLPEKITEQIGKFVLGLQHDDGYFYHPQWGTIISSSRRGRDAGWAADIIRALGLVPKYDTASGSIKGENPIVNPSSAEDDLTDRLGSSAVVAVSAVLPCAAAELASEEAFRTHLDNANISKNSYSIFNNLNSRISEIKKAGLWDFLLRYLTEKQYPNGLWEPEVTYQSVNGLMKVSTFFNSTIPFPNPDAAVRSAMSIMERAPSDEIEAIVYVYNPWVAVYNVLPYCEDTLKEELRAQIKSPSYIDGTFQKLAVFKKEDGGFSYLPESSSHMSQGEHVAVEGSRESDVNATSIAISTLNYMLRVFRVTQIPALFYDYDTLFFVENISGLGTLIKDPFIVEDPVVITFDDYDETMGEESGGVVKYPAPTAQNNIGSEDIDEDGNYRWFSSMIVDNPDPTMYDKVLYVADHVYDANGNGKFEDAQLDREMAPNGSNTEFFITNYPINGNCYVFESDIYFDGTNDASVPVAQLMFVKRASNDTSMTLNIYAYERNGQTYLRIAENFAGADGIKDDEVVGGIPVSRWFNLRVEVYKEYDVATNALDIKVKFYVDGEYAGYSDSGYYSTKEGIYLDRTISAVKFAYYRWSESRFYLNNVYVAKENKPYVHESVKGSPNEEILDETVTYDFSDGIPANTDFFAEFFYKGVDSKATYIRQENWTDELDALHGVGMKSPGIRFYSAADPTNLYNKVLKVYAWNVKSSAYNGYIYVNDSRRAENANVYELAFDYYFETLPWLFAQTCFAVEFQSEVGTRLMGLTFAAKEIPESHKDMSELVIKRDDGSVIDGVTLTSGTWYSFKMEYYYNAEDYTQSRLKMFLLDKSGNQVCFFDEIMYTKAGYIAQVGFKFTPYDIRGEHYFDNLSFATIEKAYAPEEIKAFGDIEISGLTSVLVTAPDSSDDPAANEFYGSGLYYDESVKYEDLAGTPDFSAGKNDTVVTTTGFGDEKIALDIIQSNGNNALRFIHARDAESRFQFLIKKDLDEEGKPVELESFVFETDIRFDILPEGKSRGFTIFGAKTAGKNGNIWSGATLNLKYNENSRNYYIEGAGAKYTVKAGVWYNIRLEIDGTAKGSEIRLYVNGMLVGRSALSGSIAGISAYEFMTPSSSSEGSSFVGIICFDNTYIGEKTKDSPVPEQEGDSNVSGEDMDSDAWDELVE